MNIVNLTGETLITSAGYYIDPSSDIYLNVSAKSESIAEIGGVPVKIDREHTIDVEGLPDYKEGTILIVPERVFDVLPQRPDLVTPVNRGTSLEVSCFRAHHDTEWNKNV